MNRKTKVLLQSLLASLATLVLIPAVASATEGIDAPDSWTYNGQEITAESAADLGLTCLQTETVNECYDTPVDAGAEREGGATQRVACSYRDLIEWKRPNYDIGPGPIMALAARFNWYNYNASNAATTSSFNTGDFPADFAGHVDGGGSFYPGATGTCTPQPNLATWNAGAWDNRFRSRIRH